MIAGAEIGENFPDITLITLSQTKPEDPTHAEVYAKGLEGLGISKERIKQDARSMSTLTELIEVFKMARSNNWEDIAILTNEFQIGRAQEMLNHMEELIERYELVDKDFVEAFEFFEKGKKLKIHFLNAETILATRDPRYKDIIEAAKDSLSYKKREQVERGAVQQLKDGTYGLKK